MGDIEPWSRVIETFRAWGVEVMPWRFCWYPSDVAALKEQARKIGSRRLIVNLEKTAETTCTPNQVADELQDWDGEVGLTTYPWIQDNPDWTRLKQHVLMLQLFPEDSHWPWDRATIAQKTRDCTWHARGLDQGWLGQPVQLRAFTYVLAEYQTYHGISPDVFDLRGSYALYTFDDAWPQLERWVG